MSACLILWQITKNHDYNYTNISVYCLQGFDPCIPFLSSQLLLSLGSGLDIPVASNHLPSDLAVYFMPGAFDSLAAGCIQRHILIPKVQEVLGDLLPLPGFSRWAFWWHVGVREWAFESLKRGQQQQGKGRRGEQGKSGRRRQQGVGRRGGKERRGGEEEGERVEEGATGVVQQQQQQEHGLEPSKEEVAAAVRRAYASPDAR